MIIVSNFNYISVTVFLGFVTWPHFDKMCEVTKGAWPNDIEHLRLISNYTPPATLCYVIIIICYEVFR